MFARCLAIFLGAVLMCGFATSATAQVCDPTVLATLKVKPPNWNERRACFIKDVQEALYSDTQWQSASCDTENPCLYSKQHKLQLMRTNVYPARFSVQRVGAVDNSERLALEPNFTYRCLSDPSCTVKQHFFLRTDHIFVMAKN